MQKYKKNRIIKSISNETEYQAALGAIEPFLQKGFDNLSFEEYEELARMSALIEKYEAVHYPMPLKP